MGNYNKNDYSIFAVFIFLFLFFQIKSELEECPKSEPLLVNGECKSQYCSKEQFNSSFCSINNTIMKTQWLNNIIEIGGLNYRYINFASYSNGDMIIETTSYPEDPKRCFYGFKKNGRPFFTNKNIQEETPYYEINAYEENNNKGKYESSAIIIKSSEDGEGNGKEYFLSISQLGFYVELFDFNNDKIYFKSLQSFCSFPIVKTYRHGLFPYKSSSNNYYYFFGFTSDTSSDYYNNQNLTIHFQKHIFTSISDFTTQNSISGDTITILDAYTKMISSFETQNGLIIVFYQIKTDKIYFIIRKYGPGFSEPIIDYQFESNIEFEDNFFKCINLKGEIGVFSYFKYIDSIPCPHILFKEFNTGTNSFENYLSNKHPNSEIFLNKRSFYGPSSFADIIKMNENKICQETLPDSKESVYIILMNILDNKDIKIRYYSLPLYPLYNSKILYDLRINNYNNFVAFAFSYCKDQNCNQNTDPHYTALIIFGYPNSTDSEFDLEKNLFDNNINFNELEIDLKKNLIFQNNIFGYILYKIGISTIIDCGQYKFFISNDERKEIQGTSFLNLDENIQIKYTGDGKIYPILNCIIQYYFIATEPDLNIYDIYPEIKDGDNDINDFKKEYYEGRLTYFNIKLNRELTSDCPNYCDICLSSQKEYCITCKFNYSSSIINGIKTKNCFPPPIVEDTTNLFVEETTELTTEKETNDVTVKNTEETSTEKETNDVTVKNTEETPSEKATNDATDKSTEESPSEKETNDATDKSTEETPTEKATNDATDKNTEETTNKNKYENSKDTKIIDKDSEEITEKSCENEDVLNNKCQNGIITEKQIEELNIEIKKEYLSKDKEYNGKNNIIVTENALFQITYLNNQTDPNNNDLSTVDLGDCEQKLKDHYQIPKEESLIIYKADIKTSNLIQSYIQYEIYNPVNLEKLSLSFCENSKITINSKINLDNSTLSLYDSLIQSGYNLFNINDSFYTDVCSTYTSINGTDLTLSDRQEEIYKISGNLSLCQTGCKLNSFDPTTKNIKCDCDAQIGEIEAIFSFSDEKFMDMFKDSIFVTLKNSNFRVLKCYKLVFSTKNLFKNIGRIFMTVIVFLAIILLFIFIFKDYKKIDTILISILNNSIKIDQNINNFKRIKGKNKKIKKNKKKGKNNRIITNIYESKSINSKIKMSNHSLNTKLKNNNKKLKNKKFAPPKKYKISFSKSPKKNNLSNSENNMSSKNFINENVNRRKYSNKSLNNKTNINIIKIKNVHIKKYMSKGSSKTNDNFNNKNLINDKRLSLFSRQHSVAKETNTNKYNSLNDQELNTLDYIQAIDLDKRSYCQYYISLLKKKQLILFTFYPANDFNLVTLKLCLFLTNFSIYLTMNCFFFSDDTMHKIYIDNGAYHIIYRLPQIIYTSFISSVINILLKQLSLSENNFLELKHEKTSIRITAKSKTIKECLTMKFIIFFIINFLLLFFVWYFISCFSAVFINTQITLISDTLISFGISLLYPFGYYLIPGLFRIPAIKAKQKDKQCLYSTGSIMALI